MDDTNEKPGVFTGLHAINPATNQPIPIWVADYVLMGYGHGAIMAVPGHDQRDFEFARKFDLSIAQVVAPDPSKPTACTPWASTDVRTWERAMEDEGIAVNSANIEVSINGLATRQATSTMIAWLERTGKGQRKINYKLR